MDRQAGRRGRPTRPALYAAVDEGLADLQRVGGLPHPADAEAICAGSGMRRPTTRRPSRATRSFSSRFERSSSEVGVGALSAR